MGSENFESTFTSLKSVFASHLKKLAIKTDKANEYTLAGKVPSPFPQHKGQPLAFGMVKIGRAYVSFHLVPLYMNDALKGSMSPALKKRMQGKACFNFKTAPEPETIDELKKLTAVSFKDWAAKGWL